MHAHSLHGTSGGFHMGYFIVVSSNLTLQGSYYYDLRFTEKEAETWRD